LPTHGVKKSKYHVTLTCDGGAVDGDDLIAGAQTGPIRHRACNDVTDHRSDLGCAVSREHAPEHENSKQDIETRSGEQHDDALPRCPAGKGARQILRRHGPLALVQEFYITP